MPGEQEERGGGEQRGGQRASRRSAAADRRASRRSPWGDRRGWGKRGEEKEGDDMWGPHVSEWREGAGAYGYACKWAQHGVRRT